MAENVIYRVYYLKYIMTLEKKEIIKQFGFYDSDTVEQVLEHVKIACDKLTECLIHETMIGCKFVIADWC